MAYSKKIILYHYSFSPYARRIVWYLALRKISYTQCLQPPIMPRPDIASIGTVYRRIPILSIGRDVYNDTRLILLKLEALFPASPEHPALFTSSLPEHAIIERLLEHWAIDNGLFNHASALIPSDLPLMRDPKFTKDRADYTGQSWEKGDRQVGRAEALVEIRSAFMFLEEKVLGDGREWVLGGDGVSMADIEAVWPFTWVKGLPGALPPHLISATTFPKAFAWIERFDRLSLGAMKKEGKPETVKGPEALGIVEIENWAEEEKGVDESDPTGLEKGEIVEVWPTDTGFSRRDRGKLVGLDGDEIVIESKTVNGEMVRVHAPRHGFKVRKARNDVEAVL